MNAILRMLVATAVAATPCVAQQAERPPSNAHDGSWSVVLKCADTQDRRGVVRGYVYNFTVEIVGGRVEGRFDEARAPAFVHFAGEVTPDGVLFIRADGLSGAPEATVGKVPTGTPYQYTMKGKLEAGQGKAERVELRPCTAELTKQ